MTLRPKRFRSLFILGVATLLAVPLIAQSAANDALDLEQAVGPLSRVHALTNARVVVDPTTVLERATVVVRDGMITQVGADVAAPADAWTRDLAGATLYPGLIELFHPLPWPGDASEQATVDGAAAASTPAAPAGAHPNPMVRAHRDMAAHAPDAATLRRLRGAGFTTALMVPRPGLLRGHAALINLGEGGMAHNLLRRAVAQGVHLARRPSGYPESLMGTIALLRQTVADARWYADAQARYARRPAQMRPVYDRDLAALGPAVAREQPVLFETRDVQDGLRALALIDELKLDAWLVGSGAEYQRLDAFASAGHPIVVPVDFPDAPDVGDEGDALDVSLAALRHWQMAPSNPARLRAAGATIALSSHGLDDPGQLHARVADAIERGNLDRTAALAALTTVPAQLLGLEDQLGAIRVGAIANLIEMAPSGGDLLAASPAIAALWIDGQRLALDAREAPAVNPAGVWEVVVDAGPDQQIPVRLTLSGDPEGAMTGSVNAMGGSLPLNDVVVSGVEVRFAFDGTPLGMPGAIRFEGKVDGESMRGVGEAPPGPFTFRGRRVEGPPPAPEHDHDNEHLDHAHDRDHDHTRPHGRSLR
ncbi:MAG: amidohydrolase family protein [Acidobacteriota bacterium]